jgi:hypothetical protein
MHALFSVDSEKIVPLASAKPTGGQRQLRHPASFSKAVLDEERKIAAGAAASLLVFSALTTVALFAWLSRAPEPWSWRAIIATFTAIFGLTSSALIWRIPSRVTCWLGVLVMAFSLVRIGPPDDWTWVSFTLLMITVLLMIPLVHAALVLR